MLVATLGLHPTLNPDNMGFIEKFHTKQILHKHFLIVVADLGNLISCRIVIVKILVVVAMADSLTIFINALERELLFLFGSFPLVFISRDEKLYLNQLLL